MEMKGLQWRLGCLWMQFRRAGGMDGGGGWESKITAWTRWLWREDKGGEVDSKKEGGREKEEEIRRVAAGKREVEDE
ncbi:hypothetical protein ACFXTN_019969 [Malus domestica]